VVLVRAQNESLRDRWQNSRLVIVVGCSSGLPSKDGLLVDFPLWSRFALGAIPSNELGRGHRLSQRPSRLPAGTTRLTQSISATTISGFVQSRAISVLRSRLTR